MRPLSIVVRTICNIFAWFVAIFGAYVILHGHLTPGGGFQGGAIVATFIALLLVAHGGKSFLGWVKKEIFSSFEGAGLVAFICVGFLGLSTTFLYNFLALKGGLFGSAVPIGPNAGVLNSSGTIALANIAVGLEVVGGLSAILIFMFLGMRYVSEGGKEGVKDDK